MVHCFGFLILSFITSKYNNVWEFYFYKVSMSVRWDIYCLYKEFQEWLYTPSQWLSWMSYVFRSAFGASGYLFYILFTPYIINLAVKSTSFSSFHLLYSSSSITFTDDQFHRQFLLPSISNNLSFYLHSADDQFSGGIEKYKTRIILYNDGTSFWLAPATFTSTCSIDIK